MKENSQIPFVLIERSTRADYPAVNKLMQAAPPDSLLEVSEGKFGEWIDTQVTFVAKTMDGVALGHQAGIELPVCKRVELRSAITHPDYEGIGINSKLKVATVTAIKEANPNAIITAFTERGSKSRRILVKGGLVEIPFEEIPEEMFTECPPELCVKNTSVDCGCKIYVLEAGKEFKVGS